jgi:uncharacterized protein (TIGR00369 family)
MQRPQPSPSTPSLPEWMGLEVLDDRDGASMVRLRPRPEAHNYRGVVHGGSLATLADVAMGVAANSSLGSDAWCITQAMELHYLRPGRGELIAQATTIHRGRSRVVVEALITNAEGKGVVKAVATFAVSPATDADHPLPDLSPRTPADPSGAHP